MGPLNLFETKLNIFKSRRLPISFGIPPAKLLTPRYNSSSLDRLPMACGMPQTN
ncbi:hypothetical protein PVL29_015145 [Vitis rotundifolia]|uniref:Uncharacterized protein n=1 Tax=Vitis rotundifolia TaxID=103349 RepID=A0AA38ZCZ6_VITRO|nr:hypothetical protein PVL29_015145 [Vitis rotundifolia]